MMPLSLLYVAMLEMLWPVVAVQNTDYNAACLVKRGHANDVIQYCVILPMTVSSCQARTQQYLRHTFLHTTFNP